MRHPTFLALGSLVVMCGSASVIALQTPVFRPSVTVVPVDVRVFDKDGREVSDLRREDFTILEDGKPQELTLFSHGSAAQGGSHTVSNEPRSTDPAVPSASSRTFLIVLGRGKSATVH